ncbi:MAG: hypothetical protein PHX26_00280 [Proteiniphilum sp.]|nr:hypothetical protein [Proteiniphilum sp.]
MRPAEKIGEGITDEVKNAGVVEADAEKAIDRRKDKREVQPQPRHGKDGEQKPYAHYSNIPQRPQPERCSRLQIVRVNIQKCSPPKGKGCLSAALHS